MYCKNCGSSLTERSKYCPQCGRSLKTKPYKLLTLLILSIFACAGVFSALYLEWMKEPDQAVSKASEKTQVDVQAAEVRQTAAKAETDSPNVKKENPAPPKETSQIIEDAQPKVFTILSDHSQGSGFLINDRGDVLTNAHVAEGSLSLTVRDSKGNDHPGTLIGYSNDVDIAVIRVESLAGQAPFALEETDSSELGDEVIALGSPQGFENTATIGNISGVNRTFTIEPRIYEGIYQISAPIAPGSSGGPLLDKKTEKVIAINSARHTTEAAIGFSIPLYKVMPVIHGWVSQPMTEEEITTLFYTEEGTYYYQDLYEDSEPYFNGGDYSDEFDSGDEYEAPSAEDGDEYDGDESYEESDSYDDNGSYSEEWQDEENENSYSDDIPEEENPDLPEETEDWNDESSDDSLADETYDDETMDEEAPPITETP
ncbi:zinc-ribbon domain-containing protein [Bacillus sp. FJAT-42376]|uniref:trypsin-like peptidase domain-containing protein n=1 Tax=Bacillus sp. FJAT-42376 TaxID=2014076 RepID=UPI000F4F8400|nr:trypsin-like peptidase domain-containing protein [Bacillus sp. FJAT-42376]AZB41570.1 zinc-ribbon domain-containing protein [Bacillus sp. FJAT-42376]